MEKTRVLIVDDDPNINQLIKLYLQWLSQQDTIEEE